MTAHGPGFVVPTQHDFFTVAACPWVPPDGEAVGGQRQAKGLGRWGQATKRREARKGTQRRASDKGSTPAQPAQPAQQGDWWNRK